MTSRKFLQSGDQISLFSTERNGHLCSVSFTESDIGVCTEIDHFCKNSVYYVFKESEREHEQSASGEIITYGSSVILKHKGTHKCVAASAHLASPYETDARKVELIHYEDVVDLQAFEFIAVSRYKLRLEGEPIRYGDHVVFMSKLHGLRNKMFLRVSNSKLERELSNIWGGGIGCDPTGFRLERYRSFTPDSHAFLMGGDHVRLFHKELESYFSVTGKDFDGFSCVPECESSVFTSLSIWEFENSDCTSGAPLAWRMPCRIKHLSAGSKYLALKPKESPCSASNPASIEMSAMALVLTKQMEDVDALFTLHPVDEPECHMAAAELTLPSGGGRRGGGVEHSGQPSLGSGGIHWGLLADCSKLVRRDCPFRIQHCSSGRWLHAQLQTESESEVALRRLHEARLRTIGRKSAVAIRKSRRERSTSMGKIRGNSKSSLRAPQLAMGWGTADGLAAVIGDQRGVHLSEQLMSMAQVECVQLWLCCGTLFGRLKVILCVVLVCFCQMNVTPPMKCSSFGLCLDRSNCPSNPTVISKLYPCQPCRLRTCSWRTMSRPRKCGLSTSS